MIRPSMKTRNKLRLYAKLNGFNPPPCLYCEEVQFDDDDRNTCINNTQACPHQSEFITDHNLISHAPSFWEKFYKETLNDKHQ